ncbi:MAG: hypothetical protein AAF725_01815 [Acidobacteriota bacterium]
MASTTDVSLPDPPSGPDWGLIGRQIRGILSLELRKQLFAKRALVLYFLAFGPVAVIAVWALSPWPTRELSGPAQAGQVFAYLYTGYLSTSIFLSCLILFMSLFRSEILDRSLHYYFLAPVRREVMVVGKYLAALLATAGVFSVSTAVFYLLNMSPWGFGELSRFLFDGPGFGNLLTYVGISVLACVGYGALFLLAGLVFKNPIIPALLFVGWESINTFLPVMLKKFSVLFYLWSLFPIQLADGAFAILAEPTPAYLSVPGLLLFACLILAFASWRVRRMEVTYGGDY